MKKSEQIEINQKVLQAMHDAMSEFENAKRQGLVRWLPLKYCKASYAIIGDDYAVLKSYATIVAVIDARNWCCYDFSRFVYGYTATTSQHICKFAKHFGTDRLTYRN